MRVVVALGGNAILRRDQQMTVDNQRASIAAACEPLSRLAAKHELVVSHGNGPQIGLLALQAAAYDHISEYPFDVLGASTEGMIGYLIEQELGNQLDNERAVTTLVTRTEVDPSDPAFADPTKFVGPGYTDADAATAAEQHGWTMKRDGSRMRRVVASPQPLQILELRPIQWLLEKGAVVICAGGGGVPTVRSDGGITDGRADVLAGIEAVVDKDLASAVLARDLGADLLIIATDVEGVFVDWRGTTSGGSFGLIPMPWTLSSSRQDRCARRSRLPSSSPGRRLERPSSVRSRRLTRCLPGEPEPACHARSRESSTKSPARHAASGDRAQADLDHQRPHAAGPRLEPVMRQHLVDRGPVLDPAVQNPGRSRSSPRGRRLGGPRRRRRPRGPSRGRTGTRQGAS